jgi:hypothetical protein
MNKFRTQPWHENMDTNEAEQPKAPLSMPTLHFLQSLCLLYNYDLHLILPWLLYGLLRDITRTSSDG